MDVKERQIRKDIKRAGIWMGNLLQRYEINYLVVEPDYLTPTVDEGIVLPIRDPQGLYEHVKKIYIDLTETQRGGFS